MRAALPIEWTVQRYLTRALDEDFSAHRSRLSLLKDERGRSIAILETNNDITERKRGEEKLQLAQAELARINRTTTLGELTASIAHEVNQPLAAIVIDGEVCLILLGRDKTDMHEVRDWK